MRNLIVLFALACPAAAAPPPAPPVDSRLDDVERDVKELKAEVAALKGRLAGAKAADPAKGWDCGCITFKQRCSCGAVCTCAGSYGAAADAKKAAPNPHPCISHNGYWWTWDGYDWKLGERDTTAQAVTCSAPAYGGCAGGSCGSSYGTPVFGGGVFSGFGGGCSGGSCSGGRCR